MTGDSPGYAAKTISASRAPERVTTTRSEYVPPGSGRCPRARASPPPSRSSSRGLRTSRRPRRSRRERRGTWWRLHAGRRTTATGRMARNTEARKEMADAGHGAPFSARTAPRGRAAGGSTLLLTDDNPVPPPEHRPAPLALSRRPPGPERPVSLSARAAARGGGGSRGASRARAPLRPGCLRAARPPLE